MATTLTKEESAHAEDLGNFFRIPADNRDLNYDKYFTDGSATFAQLSEFTSECAKELTVEEIMGILEKQPYVQEALKDWQAP